MVASRTVGESEEVEVRGDEVDEMVEKREGGAGG